MLPQIEKEPLSKLDDGGADLSHYRDKLTKDKNSRTLTLRRPIRPSISSIKQKGPQLSLNPSSKTILVDPNNFPFLDPFYIFSTFQSNNSSNILKLINDLYNCLKETPRLLNHLIKNSEFITTIVEYLSICESDLILIHLLSLISIIFPICSEIQQHIFIDKDICFSLMILVSNESSQIQYE